MLFDYHLFLSLRYIFHSKVIFIFCLAAVSEIGGDFMDCYCHCQSWISSILWAKEKTKKEKTKKDKWVLKYSKRMKTLVQQENVKQCSDVTIEVDDQISASRVKTSDRFISLCGKISILMERWLQKLFITFTYTFLYSIKFDLVKHWKSH